MTTSNIALISNSSESANDWNIGDSKFDSIVSSAVTAMAETQTALVYALSQALDNGNSNKINEFFHSDLCTKKITDPKWEKKAQAWSFERKLAAMPSAPTVRKQVNNGGTLLAYLRQHGFLAHSIISEETGNKEYVDGPLTFSKGKFSFTKEDKDAGSMHWRSQLALIDGETGSPLWDLEEHFQDMMPESWYQFTKKGGGKRKLDLNKSLTALIKKAVKAADDDEDDSIAVMSEAIFLEAAKKAYKAYTVESAK